MLAEHESFWVIGGGAVYAAFLPHADRLVVTDVDVDGRRRHLGAGDRTRAGTRTARTPDTGWSTSASSGLRYAVSEYVRARTGAACALR